MVNKIKANLIHVICAALGLLTFIFFAFPYAAQFAKNGSNKYVDNWSGYKVMDGERWDGCDAEFFAVLTVIFQIVLLVIGSLMLLYGVFCLLKELGILNIDAIPAKLCSKSISKAAVRTYAILTFLVLVCIIILSIANTKTISGLGGTYKYGLRIGAGTIIATVFSIGALVVDKLFGKKFASVSPNGPRVVSVCTKCGKKAANGAKFCLACGGAVEQKVIYPTVFVCTQCGARAKKGVKFCTQCGGQVVEKKLEPSAN